MRLGWKKLFAGIVVMTKQDISRGDNMKLNDMLYDLLSLAKQENEPNRYAHSEEYDKLFNELDDKTMMVDELENSLGCSLKDAIEFIRLLKKTYYIDNVTGQLSERWSPYKSNDKELYKINDIFYKIKVESE